MKAKPRDPPMSVDGRAVWGMQGRGRAGWRQAICAGQILGFRRLGKRIRAAFGSAVSGLIRQKHPGYDGSLIRKQ